MKLDVGFKDRKSEAAVVECGFHCSSINRFNTGRGAARHPDIFGANLGDHS